MNFEFNEEQQAIVDLAKQILSDGASQERLREIEGQPGPRFDPELWKRLAEAGLVGAAIDEVHGGAGLGFLEIAGILEEVGRSAAPVPLLETAVLGAMPLAEFGSAEQQREWLPRVARGEAILSAALVEWGDEDGEIRTRARREADGFRLEGVKICVPAGQLAERIWVPAATERGVGLFFVDPRAEGVSLTPLDTTSGQPEARLELAGARVGPEAVLGDPDGAARLVAWLRERATAALASLALGVCEEALRLTADYIKTRKQFDQPIAMFQAVAHRAADAYIDIEGIRLTALQAAWRISAGLPAAEQVAIAKIWAAEAGKRVVHAAAHLHGGVGVDRDYPLHRYFLYARQLELSLGGATQQLRAYGRMLAAG